jgi:RNA-directed DNA polymerase
MTDRQSDQPILPKKPCNEGGGKGLTMGQVTEGKHRPNTETETAVETKLRLLTEKSRGDTRLKFSALAHHLSMEFLKDCFEEMRGKKGHGGRPKAPGVDGVGEEDYGRNLEENLEKLVERMKAKAYRPQPVRRVYIPKVGGGERGLGLPAIEDRIVQRGIAKILELIYEPLFLEVSYGFRPGRNTHQALDRVNRIIMTRPITAVVDMDIEQFFDNVSHEWMLKFLGERIVDPSFIKLIVRFLKAGVMEEGTLHETDKGTPQGGNLSPVLSNIFLHYVLDLWFEKKVKPSLKGEAHLTRYADDFVICFERKEEAEAFGEILRERMAKFGLKVSEKKSRIIPFGRDRWKEWKEGKGDRPGTFDFLGFTHYCDESRSGKFKLGRKTSSKKFRAKLTAMSEWFKSVRSAASREEWWPILKAKMKGHYAYYGISGNMRRMRAYKYLCQKMAYKWLNRRSQKLSYNWEEFFRLLHWNPLPSPKIHHRYSALTWS